MAEEVPTLPSLAVFEEGAARQELEFKLVKEETGLVARSEDDLYDYSAIPGDFPLNGTLFIRNKETNELKPVKISVLMEISKELKIGRDTTFAQANYNEVISNFGSRAAKRIQKMRQSAAQ